MTVFILTGPTASGKSELALRLAEKFPIEIVNTDSVQFFRHMDIGTAKPSKESRSSHPHHLMDVLDPDASHNVKWFTDKALPIIEAIQKRNRFPLLVGGSGFYLRALERPPTQEMNSPSMADRLPDLITHEEKYTYLLEKDPKAAKAIHPNDTYRLDRCLEILRLGNLPSDLWNAATEQEPRVQTVWFGISLERSKLYDNINQRTSSMFQKGLVSETSWLMDRYPNCRFRLQRTIGYRESLQVLEGALTLDQAIEKVAKSSRNYAKRQLTWFRAEKRIQWIEPSVALDRLVREFAKLEK